MDTAVPDQDAVLAALNTLSQSLIDKATPLRFDIAQSDAERQAAYRLRCQALIDRGAATLSDFPDTMEHDAHDEVAIHILGWDGDELAATGRLVLPASDRLLPTEEGFDLRIEPRGRVVDIGRFTVTRKYGDREHRYFAGLLGRTWLEATAHGYSDVCGTASPGMLRLYRRIGFVVTELAPPHLYYGEERFPCRYDVVGAATALLQRWKAQDSSTSA